SVQLDSTTNIVVKKWEDIADKNFGSLGFDAKKVVIKGGEALDGREANIRSSSTNLTKLIVKAIESACPSSDVSIINSGSIRVDDQLHPPITQYDILRTMPFGGSIMEVEMKGSLLSKILSIGVTNIGTGGFLQFSEKLSQLNGVWFINNIQIKPDGVYKVALTDFLLTGGESNLGFLTDKNPDILKVFPVETDTKDSRSDIRLAIINYLTGK
ncbi:MAG: 5'-nucleotidase C-terminal domain-containing protein, partial [Ferruginibacter sp.]